MAKKLNLVQRLNRIQKLLDCYVMATELKNSPKSFWMTIKVMSTGLYRENNRAWKIAYAALMKSAAVKLMLDFLKENSQVLFQEYLEICREYSKNIDEDFQHETAQAFYSAYAEILKAANMGLIVCQDLNSEEYLRRMVEDAVIISK